MMNNIFIVGVGRSGTSLLHAILSAHRDIRGVPETGFVRKYIFGKCSNMEIDKRLERLEEFVVESNITPKEQYNKYCALFKEDFVLDKDPRLVEYIPSLFQEFDGAKIINIIRDPRDVLSSKKKASWSKNRHLLNYLVASYVQLRDGNNNTSVHTVYYEDLIREPEKTLIEICKYLSISFDRNMLDHTGSSKKLVHEDEFSWKKEVLEPINKDNTGNWKSQLNPIEILSSFYVFDRAIGKSKKYALEVNFGLLDVLLSKVYLYSCVVIAYFYVKYRDVK